IYVPLDEIVHCRSSRNYIRVHTSTRWYLLRLPLASLVAVLEPAQFIQVHRTALINIRHVTELTDTIHGDYIVRLSTGTKVRLSRRRRGAIARLVKGPDSRGPQ